MPEPLEIQTKITGVEQAQQQLDNIAQAEEKVGDKGQDAGKKAASGHTTAKAKAKEHGKQLMSVRELYDNLKQGAIGWISGFMGFSAIIGLVQKYLEYLKKVRDAMKQIANEAKQTQAGLHGLAVQLGDVSPAGFAKARAIAREISVAGGFDQQTATQLAISMDVALASRGGIVKNMPIAKEIAGIAGASTYSPEATAKLVETLQTAGALQTPERTKTAIAKIMEAIIQAKSTKPSDFIQMLQQGGTAMLTSGVSLDETLGYAMRFRQVMGSEAEAATGMLQFYRASTGASGGKAWRDYLTQKAQAMGIDWSQLNASEKMKFLGQLASQAKTEKQRMELLQAGLPGEISTALFPAFSEQTTEAIQPKIQKVTQASGTSVSKRIDDYHRTLLYKEKAAEVKREYQKTQNAQFERTFNILRENAKAAYEKAQARGELMPFESEEAFIEAFMLEQIRHDIGLKKDKAKVMGDTQAYKELSRVHKFLTSSAWIGAWGVRHGYTDQWMNNAVKEYMEGQAVQIHNYYGNVQHGGTAIHQDGRKPAINNTPGRNPIGSGDNVVSNY